MRRPKGKSFFAAMLAVLGIAATALVASGSAEPGSRFARHEVKVYFTRESSIDKNCAGTRAYSRKTVGADVLGDAMSQLLKGPRRGERKDGAASLFSSRTAGMVNSVRIEDGVAYVDFDDFRRIIPGATSSCGSASLLAELRRTAKQFSTVDSAVFSFEGSVRAFYNWLQLEPPE